MEQRRLPLKALKALGSGTDRRSLLKSLGAAAVGISFAPVLQACGAEKGEANKLNLYSWDTYLGETTLADFKKAEDIDVDLSIFATNDEMYAKMRGSSTVYDVVVPSNDSVTRLIRTGLLHEIDHAQIPNYKNIGEGYRDVPFDPGRRYSMPYTWMVMGIGYRKSKVQQVPDSWEYLFASDLYKDKIALVSEPADLMRIAAKYRGYSVNDITPERIAALKAMLLKQRPFIKTFHEDNGQDLLLSGDIDVVMEYNGDVAQIMQNDSDIDFVVPKEGSLLISDSLCIPVNAPHKGNAHRFINYLLDAEVGKKVSEKILFPTPNDAARALMPESYKENPVIFPPAALIRKSEYAVYNATLQPLFDRAVDDIIAA